LASQSTAASEAKAVKAATGRAYKQLRKMLKEQCEDEYLVHCEMTKEKARDGSIEFVSAGSKERFLLDGQQALIWNDETLKQKAAAKAAALKAVEAMAAALAWDPHKPTFYFLSRVAVLSATSKQLRRMQELRDSKLLEKMAVDLNEAFQGKGLVQNVLFVSHRWEDAATPDETGAQLAALQAHMMAHLEIQYVWFDYSCMPQRSSGCLPEKDDRPPAEKAEFDLMLKAIADLYLTAKVLILLDKMYLTRFWTTMEGWCAMQQVTSKGVRPATEGEARHTVVCIHNATQNDKRDLLEMSTRTPAEMSKFLASPDVAVTNKKDKETMLPIVNKTDKHVREMMSGLHGR
jgi:hypothetical protein